jgi:hypothetical protein
LDRLIAGRYELLGRLGTGGAATVYQARDVRLDRIVAVKVLHEQLAGDPDFLARFQREARVAASLNHPNLIDVYDYGAEGNTAYIAMPFVGGGNLKERIQARGRLPPTEAIDIARQVLSALAAAHSRGLVHRDVKPQNVLLTDDGIVKLADFGIVHVPAQAELTMEGTTIGTAAYIAPEQATGGTVGPAADLYGVGLLLYEMLVGQPPFVGGSPMEVAYRQVNEQPVPPRQIVATVPPQLDAVVMRALEKDPARRFPSAEAMLDALNTPVIPNADLTAPMTTVQMPVTPRPTYTRPAPPPPTGSRSAAGIIVTLAVLGLLAALGLAGALVASRYDFLSGGGPSTPGPSATATSTPTVPAKAKPPPAVVPPTPSPAAGAATPTVTATASPTATMTASATLTRSPTVTFTPVPPSVTPTPVPPSPTATALLRPVTSATPTLPPPVPIATPKPGAKPGQSGTVEIPSTAFQGGFRTPDGNFRGQSAMLIYGQRTPHSTMSARFELPGEPREAQLRLNGLDSEDRDKTQVEILINERPFFRGPSPFQNDQGSRPQAPWSDREVNITPGFLKEGSNLLTIRNLAESNNQGPPFIAVHSATISYRA